jgi:hypothetical protein
MVVQELFNEINVKGGNLQIELNLGCMNHRFVQRKSFFVFFFFFCLTF